MRKNRVVQSFSKIWPATLLLLLTFNQAEAVQVQLDELLTARNWAAAKFTENPQAEKIQTSYGLRAPKLSDVPFSFTLNGETSATNLKNWRLTRKSAKLDAKRTSYTLRYADPQSGLVLQCNAIDYADFPTVEWTLYLKNTGKADSPLIGD